jgi:hypothetical protein
MTRTAPSGSASDISDGACRHLPGSTAHACDTRARAGLSSRNWGSGARIARRRSSAGHPVRGPLLIAHPASLCQKAPDCTS